VFKSFKRDKVKNEQRKKKRLITLLNGETFLNRNDFHKFGI